jgi:peptidoglycan/xylan/chitin deacetylase (PgdA/CDA1 family)
VNQYPILTYHKVTPQWELSFTMLYPEQFSRQMQFLADKGYQGCSLQAYLADPAEKRFVLTFDDAYESAYRYAAPVLERLGFSATLFVPTAYMGRDNTWDFTPGNIRSRHMDNTQLLELHEKGWEIASHGESHRVLTRMSDRELRRELEDSKIKLEQLTTKPVDTFCFPFGVYDQSVVEAAKKAGYRHLVGFTGKSRFGVITRSVVYRVVDNPRSVLRKIRIGKRGYICEHCKEQLFHAFSVFAQLKQKIST